MVLYKVNGASTIIEHMGWPLWDYYYLLDKVDEHDALLQIL